MIRFRIRIFWQKLRRHGASQQRHPALVSPTVADVNFYFSVKVVFFTLWSCYFSFRNEANLWQSYLETLNILFLMKLPPMSLSLHWEFLLDQLPRWLQNGDFLTPFLKYTYWHSIIYIRGCLFSPVKCFRSFSYRHGLIDSYPMNIVPVVYFDAQMGPHLDSRVHSS